MPLLKEMMAKLINAISLPATSGFICQGCELRNYCRLPARRRRLCCESRALRAQL
jgi:hypothetical protein